QAAPHGVAAAIAAGTGRAARGAAGIALAGVALAATRIAGHGHRNHASALDAHRFRHAHLDALGHRARHGLLHRVGHAAVHLVSLLNAFGVRHLLGHRELLHLADA